MRGARWAAWLWTEVGNGLLPLFVAVVCALFGQLDHGWVEDVFWGNELPFGALTLALLGWLEAREQHRKAALEKVDTDADFGRVLGLGTLAVFPFVSLVIFYFEKFHILGLHFEVAATKGLFCWALLVCIGAGIALRSHFHAHRND